MHYSPSADSSGARSRLVPRVIKERARIAAPRPVGFGWSPSGMTARATQLAGLATAKLDRASPYHPIHLLSL